MIWPRLGINIANNFNNYGIFPSDDFANDLNELWNIGFRFFRVAMPNWNNSSAIDVVKQACLAALARGGSVMGGISSTTVNDLNASSWPNYKTSVLSFVQWAKDNNLTEVQLANELESTNDDTTLTDSQLRSNLRSLSTDARSIWPNGKFSISVAQGQQAQNWINDANKGDLDYVHINAYGHSNDTNGFLTEINNFFKVYKDGYVTEWNIDPTDADIQQLTIDEQISLMKIRYDYIRDKKINRAYFFTWRWYGSDQFSLKKTDGSYRDDWINVLTKLNRRREYVVI